MLQREIRKRDTRRSGRAGRLRNLECEALALAADHQHQIQVRPRNRIPTSNRRTARAAKHPTRRGHNGSRRFHLCPPRVDTGQSRRTGHPPVETPHLTGGAPFACHCGRDMRASVAPKRTLEHANPLH